jgi:signal transduction histidine kinase/CheY-like chemotaxis protein
VTAAIDKLDLAAASYLWRAIIDDMPHMISVKDAKTRRYVFCNPECDKVLGPDAIGRTNFDLLEHAVAERIEAEETALITEGGFAIVETMVTDQTGRQWIMRTKKFLVDRPGEGRYLITVSEDVSEKHDHARRLDQAIEAALAANAAKSSFLANMSHEIRTPLNGVLGMAQAMAADHLSPDQRGRLEIVQQSGQTLLAILNDILDISKIEAGKLSLEDGEFQLLLLLSTVQATFSPLAKKKNISLSVFIDPEAAGCYRGDAVRVRQILYNLVSNAIKFTSSGGVQIRASRDENLLLTVSDTGIGIPDDRAEAMFDKFEQADTSTARQFGGTGLGLSICRELCHLMGGQISVTSTPGTGSVFSVELPLTWRAGVIEAEKENIAKLELDQTSSIRVLAAEDNPVNQIVLKTLLNQFGVEPVIVGDGVLVVSAWEDEEWDIILMDVRMPTLDGIEACKLIRQKERHSARRRTPIIALTADAMDHQKTLYLEAGMDGYVAKPIDAANLLQTLQQFLSTTSDALELK